MRVDSMVGYAACAHDFLRIPGAGRRYRTRQKSS
jgi:hypothetical protein